MIAPARPPPSSGKHFGATPYEIARANAPERPQYSQNHFDDVTGLVIDCSTQGVSVEPVLSEFGTGRTYSARHAACKRGGTGAAFAHVGDETASRLQQIT